MSGAAPVLVVDAANVVGSRPTGWWRDRAGAAAGFVDALRAAAAGSLLPVPVVVVLEGAARGGAAEGEAGNVRVVHAPGAGDDAVVAAATTGPPPVVVVSADRALGARCRDVGAQVVGPGWLLDRLGR